MTESLPFKAALFALAMVGMSAVLATAAPAPGDPPAGMSDADKIRKALDTKVTAEFDNQSLDDAINSLKDQAKININVQLGGFGIDRSMYTVTVKMKDAKLKSVLNQMLAPLGMAYHIEKDVLVISMAGQAEERQVRQRVSGSFDKVPLEKALKDLAKETGTQLIIDPRHAAKAKDAITLEFDDIPLEVAVRLISDMAGLRSVRQANILYITSKETAAELKKEEDKPAQSPYGPFFPGGGVIPFDIK